MGGAAGNKMGIHTAAYIPPGQRTYPEPKRTRHYHGPSAVRNHDNYLTFSTNVLTLVFR